MIEETVPTLVGEIGERGLGRRGGIVFRPDDVVEAEGRVVDLLREVGPGVFGIEREEVSEVGELGKVVGQDLVKEHEIGLELLREGLAGRRGRVGQAHGADAVEAGNWCWIE